MKKFFKLVIGFIIALVILIIAMVACTSFFANEVDKELKKSDSVSSVDSKDDSKESAKDESPKEFKLGDTVKVGDIQLTISQAQNQSPDQYSETKNNNVVVFDITAVNKGTDSAYIDNTEFDLYINDEKVESYYGSDEMAISDDLNKGKTLKGKIFFDAPKGQQLELIYKPSFSWNDNEVVFTGKN
ncbi:DUF4352 domain-containing protein [Exiguobacterium sp. s127]|uniref:DUF4352 domain-containing protein n=1 Tax=Exiguobacterium sp. s127 TaxID=2751210 RepID=UPI001BEA5518|nr:DUF4352 domain-containing protein [Exiguobacterium sp. s127]